MATLALVPGHSAAELLAEGLCYARLVRVALILPEAAMLTETCGVYRAVDLGQREAELVPSPSTTRAAVFKLSFALLVALLFSPSCADQATESPVGPSPSPQPTVSLPSVVGDWVGKATPVSCSGGDDARICSYLMHPPPGGGPPVPAALKLSLSQADGGVISGRLTFLSGTINMSGQVLQTGRLQLSGSSVSTDSGGTTVALIVIRDFDASLAEHDRVEGRFVWEYRYDPIYLGYAISPRVVEYEFTGVSR